MNGNCHLKLADFGLARLYNENQSKIIAMTEYVTTRWYRAPEVLVGMSSRGVSTRCALILKYCRLEYL